MKLMMTEYVDIRSSLIFYSVKFSRSVKDKMERGLVIYPGTICVYENIKIFTTVTY